MSVVIKGMKMPDKCGLCPLFRVEWPMYCRAFKADKNKEIKAPYGEPIPDWCPLIELPEKHGRLIGADELKIALNSMVSIVDMSGIEKALEVLDEAETVVEAEGMNMQELKPCPFCGGDANHVYDPNAIEDTTGRKWAYMVVCDICATSTGLCFSKEQATEAWNRRVEQEE